MRYLPKLGYPAYFLAGVLVLFPAADLLQAVWPIRLGDIAWRFGTAGLLARVSLTPLLGLALAFAGALLLEHRGVLRVLAVINGVLAVALLAGASLFLLDAVQMRGRVAPDARSQFYVGSVVSLVKFGVAFLFLVGLAVTEWRTSRALGRKPRSSRRRKSTPAEKAATVVPPSRISPLADREATVEPS